MPNLKSQPDLAAGRVILFGGGDAGGLIIGPGGVRPIPPFGPAILYQLRAISTLLNAERELADAEDRRQLGSLTNRLANLAIGQVEAEVGQLDAASGLVYQGDDGGFTCGSTGKPPIPFPWPPGLPGLGELIAAGVLDASTLDSVARATNAGADVADLLRDPAREAERLGVSLTDEAAKQLSALGAVDPDSLADPVDREIVTFFRKSLEKPEVLNDWAAAPLAVAERLGIPLSRKAGDRIIAASGVRFGGRDPGAVMSPAAVAIVVVIVIVVWDRERRIPVTDLSGMDKF